MELKALADISERFIEHYEQFEVLVGDMCKDADASLWTEDMRFWFNHSLEKLVGTKLETVLNTKSDDGRYDGKAYDRDGLRAVAHLSGKTGMKKFVRSKGDYNPQDTLGTSAQDYYDKFSGDV